MLRVLLPVVCGILLASFYQLPPLFWVGGALAMALMMVVARSSIYAFVLLLMAGAGSYELSTLTSGPPLNERALIRLRIIEEPMPRPYGARSRAEIEAWRLEDEPWRGAHMRANLYLDTTLQVELGERLMVRSTLRPYNPEAGYWSRLQHVRGYGGMIFLNERAILERQAGRGDRIQQLHERAVERIGRLDLSPESRAVVLAMSCGEHREVDSLMRRAYSRSGASHLLAVSGLHVGVVFLLGGALLALLPLLKRGHLVRSLLLILMIWLYAAMTGFSPSVVRASTMFTLFQAGILLAGYGRGMNTLCGALTLILLLNPASLFDISLQLSALAVAAIIGWMPERVKRLQNPLARWLVASLMVSLVATVVTLPLISYRFGVISLVGILLSPLVILTAELIVGLSMLWIVAPIGWLAPLFGWVIEALARVQNGVVYGAAKWGGAALECRISEGVLLVIYLFFALFTSAIWCVEDKKTLSLLSQ